MPEREWYKNWFNSSYYHKLYFDRDDNEAQAFIKRLVNHLKPAPGATMLDVACGKGRHSKFLASLGYDVTGIDISPESIAYANQFTTDQLQFFVHDMRLLFRVNYYDFVFNFFTSFGYFPTRREHDDAMRTMAASVKKEGVLMIDYLNVHYSEDHLVHEQTKQIDQTFYRIRKWHDSEHFFKSIEVNDPSLSEPIIHTEKVAKFSLGDFTDMLAFQDMQVQEVFGNYELGPYHVRDTPRLILLARKSNR